jgi:adenylate cyclase
MDSLLAYVPYHIIGDLARNPHASLTGQRGALEAVVLFADISGFTPMSEALGRHGNAGTEELTELINDYFQKMIDLVGSAGGLVGGFGGDAMTVLFPYQHNTRSEVARHAIQCALDIQQLMDPYGTISTSAGLFSLAVKIGMASGKIFYTVVGNPDSRLQSIIAGEVVAAAAEAEHHARKGEVILHGSLADLADEVVVGEQRSDFLQITGLLKRNSVGASPKVDYPQNPYLLERIRPFIHPATARRIQDGQTSFINEHRNVTILFVSFEGFDYDRDPAVAQRLQQYFSRVLEIVQHYDGDLNKIDMGDKGSKYVVLFGAPVSHEDDPVRAMLCALELHAIPETRVKIGIASGLIYCGVVGASFRREYTVMGDIANIAARMMQAAQPGQILVHGPARRLAAGRFAWRDLPPITVKGKTEPVPVAALDSVQQRETAQLQEPSYRLPMVGREAEIQQVDDLLSRVLQGRGQVVGITAEAGMGKSRLMAELIRLARRRGLASYGGECVSHGTNVSYLPWRSLLQGVFDLDPAWSIDYQVRELYAWLDRLGTQHAQRLPLLGVALNLPIEENNLTRSLDLRVRKEALEATILAAIRQRSTQEPLLLVLEDCHWMDALSHDLLEVIARGVSDRPVLILLAYRPPDHEHNRLRVSRLINWSELRLTEFTMREVEWLIGLKFGYLFGAKGVLPPSFVTRITERSQGNPFYIDQLISFIQDKGISPSDSEALNSLDLPNSLRSLIISRIDQLGEPEQITLKVASVVGRSFRPTWLWGIYPPLGTPVEVQARLDYLSALDLTPLDKTEPELEYLFKHVVTQEAAYESLTFAIRTTLHDKLGEYIEDNFADEIERYLDLLAFHYGRSQNVAKQREYFRKAGQAAQAAYANEAAINYYQRLYPLCHGSEQAEIMLRLGDVYKLVGRWAEAEQIYRQTLALAEEREERTDQARALVALGGLLMARGEYYDALEALEDAYSIYAQLNDDVGCYQSLWTIGSLQIDMGDYAGALAYLQRSLDIAIMIEDQRRVGNAIGYMGLAYLDMGQLDRALICLEQGALIATQYNDWHLLGRSRLNIGFIYLNQRRVLAAMEQFTMLFARAAEVGDQATLAEVTGEMGRAYLLNGQTEDAFTAFCFQVSAALDLGDRRNLTKGLGYTARALFKLGMLTAAGEASFRAIRLSRVLKLPYWTGEFLYDRALRLFKQQRLEEALECTNEAVSIVSKYGSHRGVRFAAALLSVSIRGALGITGPIEAIDELAELASEWHDDYERAAIHEAIWRLDPTREEDRHIAAALYYHVINNTPTADARQHYRELTGTSVPDSHPLPDLPDQITRQIPDIESLMPRVDRFLDPLV